jgi:TetR/AcrR family fatty acid metabolism transcriptional regulator
MRTKKDVIAEFRKSELLSAARAVFARRGFHEATIDDIAHEAGVAKGTVYLYFESKQQIYLEALRFGIESLNAEMNAKAQSAGGCADKLRQLVAAKIEFFDKHRDFFQIFHSEFGHAGTDAAGLTLCKDLYFEQAKVIERVLQEGIQEGSVRKVNLKKTALSIADLTRGIATQRMLGLSKTHLSDEIDFIFGLLWKGIAQ